MKSFKQHMTELKIFKKPERSPGYKILDSLRKEPYVLRVGKKVRGNYASAKEAHKVGKASGEEYYVHHRIKNKKVGLEEFNTEYGNASTRVRIEPTQRRGDPLVKTTMGNVLKKKKVKEDVLNPVSRPGKTLNIENMPVWDTKKVKKKWSTKKTS